MTERRPIEIVVVAAAAVVVVIVVDSPLSHNRAYRVIGPVCVLRPPDPAYSGPRLILDGLDASMS
jgi:hypothetical protein